jgi:endonuclease G
MLFTAGYSLLPWSVRRSVYDLSPGVDRTLRRQGFRRVEFWAGLGLWGRDCRAPALPEQAGRHLYGGPPKLTAADYGGINVLENESYLAGYSEELKNPVWVAYRVFDVPELTLGSRPSFRTDYRTEARVAPGDYRGSGYDRGHMAPNFAIATRYGESGQRETFLMSNIIPQTDFINRYLWRDLEERIAVRYGRYLDEVWVMTGPVFSEPVKRLPSGVAVPTAYYKIVADVQDDTLRVMAFLVQSRSPPYTRLKTTMASIDELEGLTGLDFFAGLPPETQAALESRPAGRFWPWLLPALRYQFKD